MKAHPLIVYIPDRRDVEVSGRYTAGNNKLGYEVFTYSRLAGRSNLVENIYTPGGVNLGTCPGSTAECEAICYAKRIGGVVRDIYIANSETDDVPEIPGAARLLRIHVSGDFSSPTYIDNWIARLRERPDVTAWAYTRSWRVPELLPSLEELRALPNMQLFASMDASSPHLPPTGWRRAWIWRDWDNGLVFPVEHRLRLPYERCPTCGGSAEYEGEYGPKACMNCTVGDIRQKNFRNLTVVPDKTSAYVCPEETQHKANCVECGYCFEGKKHDVVFLEH